MDVRSWILCFPIKWLLDSLAVELANPSPGTHWRTILIKDGPHWTYVVQDPDRPVLQIVQSPGPREGRVVVTFRIGPLDGRSFHVSSRHPAHASVFRLTAAHRDAEADAKGLN